MKTLFILFALIMTGLVVSCGQTESTDGQNQAPKEATFDITITRPAEDLSQYGELSNSLEAFISQMEASFRGMYDPETQPVDTTDNWAMDINMEVIRDDDRIVTVFGQTYMYSGGAHGNIFYHSWNYDKLESRLISLEDLLGENLDENLATLSQMSIEKITELDISDESWIATGAGADVANFSTWYITQEGGLKITFDPYQVAAYAAGPVELVFSQEEISGIIAPKYHPLLGILESQE